MATVVSALTLDEWATAIYGAQILLCSMPWGPYLSEYIFPVAFLHFSSPPRISLFTLCSVHYILMGGGKPWKTLIVFDVTGEARRRGWRDLS